MDTLIKWFDSDEDKDLMLCRGRGVAYQREMKRQRVKYDDSYWKKVEAYEGTEIAIAINDARCDFVQDVFPGATSLIDVGAGTGDFIRTAVKRGIKAMGFDVMKKSNEALVRMHAYSTNISAFPVVTMWDTIEHMDMPELRLNNIPKNGYLFVSIPIFENLDSVRASKHYRPGEHLYYFTKDGFIQWMKMRSFRLIAVSDHEVRCGRESIVAFAFKKDLPMYHDYIGEYCTMHASRFYGSSAVELHLNRVLDVVKKVRPLSIVDYGCGRSDLASHFWHDGARRIAKYDPAIPLYKTFPAENFDLALCCDVLEHIPANSVQRVLDEVKRLSDTAVFTISTKLARAKLPNGENAHTTLLTRTEWKRWISSVFGAVEEIPTEWDHELFFIARKKS